MNLKLLIILLVIAGCRSEKPASGAAPGGSGGIDGGTHIAAQHIDSAEVDRLIEKLGTQSQEATDAYAKLKAQGLRIAPKLRDAAWKKVSNASAPGPGLAKRSLAMALLVECGDKESKPKIIEFMADRSNNEGARAFLLFTLDSCWGVGALPMVEAMWLEGTPAGRTSADLVYSKHRTDPVYVASLKDIRAAEQKHSNRK